jgi:hypothetical protein
LIVGIRKPRYTHHELFTFDQKTGHIRLASSPSWVLSVQRGVNRRGAHLVLRQAQNSSTQKWRYNPKRYHNWSPFSNFGLCMDVAAGRDVDAQHVIVWSCHNGANQRFEVSYNVGKGTKAARLPIKPNTPFYIQSRMGGGRVLYISKSVGNGQYEIAIREAQHNAAEIWTYDV